MNKCVMGMYTQRSQGLGSEWAGLKNCPQRGHAAGEGDTIWSRRRSAGILSPAAGGDLEQVT